MEIKRDRYLNKLISFMWDGQVKVITGIPPRPENALSPCASERAHGDEKTKTVR